MNPVGNAHLAAKVAAGSNRLLEKIVAGTATLDELNLASEVASNITGNTICAFGDGAAGPILAFVQKFRASFEDYIRSGGSSQTQRLAL